MTARTVIVSTRRRVTVTRNPLSVVVLKGEYRVVRAGIQGPAGSPGADAEGVTVTGGTSGVNAYQVVFATTDSTVQAANSAEPSHAGRVVGMTEAAIAEGATGTVRTGGAITNSAWSLSPGLSYFLAAGGEISLNIPSSGFIQRIGTARDSTTLIINMGEPIKT